MKLSTNQIRDKLTASPDYTKHAESWAHLDEISLIMKAADVYFTPSLCEKVKETHKEARLAATAELLYVLQWKDGFDLEKTIEFYVTFDARNIADDGKYETEPAAD